MSYSETLIPPDASTKGDIGDGDFRAVGEQFVEHFVSMAGLVPASRVLDVGCGSGRMAAPLTAFLDPAAGSYEGFDITEPGISWCQAAYRGYANFTFRRFPIRSDFYGVAEGVAAEEFVFPYRDGEFDFVFLTSVFTHLMPAVVEHYLDEIHRVLKIGGCSFATYYLIDAHSLTASEDTPAALKFHLLDLDEPVWATDRDVPEAVTAYDLDYVLSLYRDRGYQLEGLHRGLWPLVYPVLMPAARSWQDIVVARKVRTVGSAHA